MLVSKIEHVELNRLYKEISESDCVVTGTTVRLVCKFHILVKIVYFQSIFYLKHHEYIISHIPLCTCLILRKRIAA